MDPDLQLDPLNPPKYCPQCARTGLKSKVKKFKMDPSSTEVVIMCKNGQCPWPFSVQSPAGATVKSDELADVLSSTNTPSQSSKKRKSKQTTTPVDPTDVTSSTDTKKVKLDCSTDNTSKSSSLSGKPQQDISPSHEHVFISSGSTDLQIPLDNTVEQDKRDADNVQAATCEAFKEREPGTSDQIFASTNSLILSKSDENLKKEDSSSEATVSNVSCNQQEFLCEAINDLKSDGSKSEKQSNGVDVEEYSKSEPEIEASSCKVSADVQTPPIKAPVEVQAHQIQVPTPIQASSKVQMPLIQALVDVQTPQVQAPADVQTPLIEAPEEVQTPQIQAPADVTPIPASSDVQKPSKQDSAEVHTPLIKPLIQAPTDVQAPKLLASEDAQPLTVHAPADVHTPTIQAHHSLGLAPNHRDEDSTYVRITKHPRAVPFCPTLESAVVVESELTVFAASPCLVVTSLLEGRNLDNDEDILEEVQKVKTNEVITRSGRKVKPKRLNSQEWLVEKSKEARIEFPVDIKSNVNHKLDSPIYPRKESSENCSANKTDVKEVRKSQGLEKLVLSLLDKRISGTSNDSSIEKPADLDDEEHKRNLEEEKRIQSLIKPPYPRRRQRGRKSENKASRDSSKSKSTVSKPTNKRHKTPSKKASVDFSHSSEKTRHKLSLASQSPPVQAMLDHSSPQTSATCLSKMPVKCDTVAESTDNKQYNEDDDILEKVKKALENQNKLVAKSFGMKLKEDSGSVVDATELTISNGKRDTFTTVDDNEETCDVDDNEESQFLKPKRTFQKNPKKSKFKFLSSMVTKPLGNVDNINLDAGVKHNESLISLLPPSIICFKVKDQEMEKVYKIGTGATLTCGDESESPFSELEHSQVQLEGFCVASQAQYGVDYSKKEYSEGVVDSKEANLRTDQNSQENWFHWREWKVDIKCMEGFSDYMRKLILKWKPPTKSKIDPRIQALQKEKEENKENPQQVMKMITFFSQVFVKYLYIKTNFPNMELEKVLGILKQNHTLENQQFMYKIQIMKDGQQQTPVTDPIVITSVNTTSSETAKQVTMPVCRTSQTFPSYPPTAHSSKRNTPFCSDLPVNMSTSALKSLEDNMKLPINSVLTKIMGKSGVKDISSDNQSIIQMSTLLDLENKNRKRTADVEEESESYVDNFNEDIAIINHSSFNTATSEIEPKKQKESKQVHEKSELIGKPNIAVDEKISRKTDAKEVEAMEMSESHADTGAAKKYKDFDLKVAIEEEITKKNIKKEKRTEKGNKKVSLEGDGDLLKKLLNIVKSPVTDTKFEPSDNKCDLVKKVAGSRRKNTTPTQVMTKVKQKANQKPEIQVDDVLFTSSSKKQDEGNSLSQGNTNGSNLPFKGVAEANFASGSTGKVVQKPSQGKTCTAAVDNGSMGLGSFDQAFARKNQADKIRRVLEKQKRKADAGSTKKYRGFGEKFDPEEELPKKKIKKEKKKVEIVKKAQVSKSEQDLLEELLNIADTAVAAAKSTPSNNFVPDDATKQSPVDTSAVLDFEEFQTFGRSLTDDRSISEDFDSLFDLH